MGLFANLKVLCRKSATHREPIKITVEVHRVSDSTDKKDDTPTFTIYTTCTAEQVLPALLKDAAHSPEVLSLGHALRLPILGHDSPAPSISLAAMPSIDKTSVPSAAPTHRSLWLKVTDFQQIRPLGSGSYGDVYLVEHKATRMRVAMKVLNKRVVEESSVVREKNLLRTVGTSGVSGINEFLGSFHNRDNYYLLTKYYPGGDLRRQIRQWGRLPLALARTYAAELLVAIKTVHDLGVVHRDIKPENILVSETGHLILTDFGLAKSVAIPGREFIPGSELHAFLRSWCGSLQYMAPEVYQGMSYALPADIWSFAVVVFEMIVGRTPWSGRYEDDRALTEQKLLHTTFDGWLGGEIIDKEARRFLEGMLDIEPFWRPTPMEATTHPFFADIDWPSILQGTNALPDVGIPPTSSSSSPDTFIGSFSGGGAYTPEEDPHPEFHYAAPIFDMHAAVDEPTAADLIATNDSFDDISLDSSESLAPRTPAAPPPVLHMAPPPACFGMMAGVTTTVTVVTVEDPAPGPEIAHTPQGTSAPRADMAFQVGADLEVRFGGADVSWQPTGVCRRLVSWIGRATSSVLRLFLQWPIR